MLKKVSSIIEYIAWLYKQNIEMQKATGSIFRIVNTEIDKSGVPVLDVQVINKSTIFRCSAKEIAAQDQLLECFSKSDVRAITYLATKELLKPKNKIVSFEYNANSEQTILRVKNIESDEVKSITVDKILANSDYLNNFSQEDAHRAGYLMAAEQMILEKKAIEKLKRNA